MDIVCQNETPADIYHLMTQTVVPRPIAWVLTEHPNQSYNLAPFSYFAPISSQPPVVVFSGGVKPTDGSVKDSIANFERTERAVIHIAHTELAAEVTESARTLPLNESELDRCNLSLTEFTNFPMPRIAECRVALGCTLQTIHEIGTVPQRLVVAEVTHLYIDDNCIEMDAKGRRKIPAAKLDPLGRLGAGDYAGLGEVIHIPRPD